MSKVLNVLIVDDEEIVRLTLHEFIDFLGHQSDCVENGPSGLEALEKGDYHAAIVDIRMPGFDGITFLHRAKEMRLDIPIVLITGHGTDETRKEALEAGAFSFISKPFRMNDIQELMDRIASATTP
jgi:DNA-binding NtrC family response regulator